MPEMALYDSAAEQRAADANPGRVNITVSPDLYPQPVELKGTYCSAYAPSDHITLPIILYKPETIKALHKGGKAIQERAV